MKRAIAALLVVHGLIHLTGLGGEGTVAAVGLFAAAVALSRWPRWWWAVALPAVVLSQVVIITAWSSAALGTLPNVVLLGAAVGGFFMSGPTSVRAQYEKRVARAAPSGPPSTVTEADLERVPPLVARYLRAAGVVGTPRVRTFRARMSGRLRSGPTAPWMSLTAEQVNVVDPPTRLFYMTAIRGGVPAVGLHAYQDGAASMLVKVAGVATVVDRSGADFTAVETVTLLNDLCFLAPAGLLDAPIGWREVSDTEVEATYTAGPHTVRATLVFDPTTGMMVNFLSDDRPALDSDGVRLVPMRWSTPVSEVGQVGPLMLGTRAEARYAAPEGDYAYGEFRIEALELLPAGA